MKLKSVDYQYFYDFTDAIVVESMKQDIKSEKAFMKKHGMKKRTELLKAAMVILEYYT